MRDDSCSIHEYFAAQFYQCYGPYTWENRDTSSFGPADGTALVIEIFAAIQMTYQKPFLAGLIQRRKKYKAPHLLEKFRPTMVVVTIKI